MRRYQEEKLQSEKSQPLSATSSVSSVSKPAELKSPTSLTENGKYYPVGNGGVCDNYYWTQTLKELTIYVDIPLGIKGKDIICNISSKTLHLHVKSGDEYLHGDLEDVVKPDDSLWTLVSGPNPQIVITLEKAKHTWWGSPIRGHPQIDTTKVSEGGERAHKWNAQYGNNEMRL